LGDPLDGLGPLKPDDYYPIFPAAPGILERQVLKDPLETGTKVLDAMIPIGLGQRQLVLGNKGTGKTTFITDVVLNQKNTGVICIYCATGKARSQLARVVQLFKDNDAFDYSIIVSAPSSSPPGQQYLSPYVACSIGEYFMKQGKNVFVGFDDFTKHAWCYREISLLLGRPPGRDSYPGDIFYLHSKMIERACVLNEDKGGGSMTFLPIVEILEGDLTAFVPTNLISMTDGQICLDAQMFGEGQRPALELGLSVSRVGTKVQWPIVKNLASPLRLEYLQYKELLKASQLRAGEQSDEAKAKLKSGAILTELLLQDKDTPVPMETLVILFYGFNKQHLHKLTMKEVRQAQIDIFEYTQKSEPELLKIMRERKKMDEEIEGKLENLWNTYVGKVEAERPEDVVVEEKEDDNDILRDIGRDILDEATAGPKKEEQ
ncbi:MAG: F0F1 ATP synthase subunit alpha, partial [Candidatus Omnitrophica bacterium]|nr:F0F1 ATP synthase subunit alpha [Candidatus Omnitrophota bacterium]